MKQIGGVRRGYVCDTRGRNVLRGIDWWIGKPGRAERRARAMKLGWEIFSGETSGRVTCLLGME